MNDLLNSTLNKLTKWRAVFTGWQLGTRPIGDPEAQAVRDHRELSILLRVELSAIARLLVEKKLITVEEYDKVMIEEASILDKAYERKFPGYKSSLDGMVIDPKVVKDTIKGWRP